MFAGCAFGMALVCVWVLFTLLRGYIFSYLDELDVQAHKIKNLPKGLPAEQRATMELARSNTAVALAIVSAAKTILAGLIVLAMALAVVG